MSLEGKSILDPCCGGKMFYIDKNNPNVLFCDNREMKTQLCDGRTYEVKPDMLCDVTKLPFPDKTFWHVCFDPPHLVHGGDSSWIVKKYGKLPKEWQTFLHDAFAECWRVLKDNGTLIFKWNEYQIGLQDVITAIGHIPVYAQKQPKQNKTHWMCFVKYDEVRK